MRVHYLISKFLVCNDFACRSWLSHMSPFRDIVSERFILSQSEVNCFADEATIDYVNQNIMVDQAIQRSENLNTSLPATSTYSFDNTSTSLDWGFNMYPTEPIAPSVAPLLEAPNLLPRGRYIRSQNPWNPHDANGNVFNENSNANCVGYEPEPAPLNSYEHERSPLPYETSSPVDNERLIVAGHGQQSHDVYGPEAPRPNWFDESDTSTSYSNTLYTPSHGSPVSQHSPQSHGSQAPLSPDEANIHSHVFSAFPEPQKNKVTRGRVRPLTEKEKREARDVRQAGACWACHLSKIKVRARVYPPHSEIFC